MNKGSYSQKVSTEEANASHSGCMSIPGYDRNNRPRGFGKERRLGAEGRAKEVRDACH